MILRGDLFRLEKKSKLYPKYKEGNYSLNIKNFKYFNFGNNICLNEKIIERKVYIYYEWFHVSTLLYKSMNYDVFFTGYLIKYKVI